MARVRVDDLQLLKNAALNFDTTCSGLVLPLDVPKPFAHLIRHALRYGSLLRVADRAFKKAAIAQLDRRAAMRFEDDLRRVEKHIAKRERLVQRQKGLIVRLRTAGVNTLDAQRILWLLESNLRRLEELRDRLRANVRQ